MEIRLIDVDSHNFPNLPLMKISAYHKEKGDSVRWYNPLTAWTDPPDRVYMSKVFTFTPEYEHPINAAEIVRGGTGYNYPSGGDPLPEEIEHIYPDYELYGITNTAYGFLTRGCPRNCDFCIVGKKEGLCSRKVADLAEFWKGQKEIKLLDPNILAAGEHRELLEQLAASGAWVDFTQGLDARLLTEGNIEIIKQIRLKMVHFAWDDIADEKLIVPKLQLFKEKTGIDKRKCTVYVLANFNSTLQEDLHRVYTIRTLGMTPFVMVYEKQAAPKEIKDLQRWVNNRIIWYSTEKFEDYRRSAKKKQGGNIVDKVHFSTGRDDWGTPRELFDALNREFAFTLDPCADEDNHKCARYYTREQDGLAQPWEGETVFCNPPYSRKTKSNAGQAAWIEKCYREAQAGSTVVMLIAARTDTAAFHNFILGKAEIRFIEGRLKFEIAGKKSRERAPFPSMVVIFQEGRPAGIAGSIKAQ